MIEKVRCYEVTLSEQEWARHPVQSEDRDCDEPIEVFLTVSDGWVAQDGAYSFGTECQWRYETGRPTDVPVGEFEHAEDCMRALRRGEEK